MAKASPSVHRALARCIQKIRDAKIQDQRLMDQLSGPAFQAQLSDEKLKALYSELWDALDVIHSWKLREMHSGSDGPEEPILVRKKPPSSREQEL